MLKKISKNPILYLRTIKILLKNRRNIIQQNLRLAAKSMAYKRNYEMAVKELEILKKNISPLLETMDVGFFRLDFNKLKLTAIKEGPHCESLKLLTAQLTQLIDQENYSELVSYLFSNNQIRIAHTKDNNYFKSYAIYSLACYFSAINHSDKARYYANQIDFGVPLDGADLLPFDIRYSSRVNCYIQNQAIDKGVASIVLIALPKSASAFLSNALSEILDAPIGRITVGESFESFPVPAWIHQISYGGFVTHEHMSGTLENIQQLQSGGIKDIWIQIRDPRDAANSLVKSHPAHVKPNTADYISMVRDYAAWIERWLVLDHHKEVKLNIHFITYQQVTQNFRQTLQMILNEQMNNEMQERINNYIKKLNVATIPNFRKGISGEWKSFYDEETQHKVWEVIPENVKKYLNLSI